MAAKYETVLHNIRTQWTQEAADASRNAIQDLQRRIDDGEAEISRSLPTYSVMQGLPTVEDLAHRLSESELLIEFVYYQPTDLATGRTEAQRYGAFLLDRSGPLTWVDLGRTAALDGAVRDIIRAADDWSTSLSNRQRQSVRAAEQTADDAISLVSSQLAPLWTAIRKRPARIGSIRVSPDGMLTLLPFEAVKVEGQPVINRFEVSYLSSARDLVRKAETTATGEPVIAVSPGSTEPAGAPRESARAFRADSLERLSNAMEEARRIRRWIPGARLLEEGNATEETLKSLKRPSLLHVVGHGLVRGKDECGPQAEDANCGIAGISPGNRVMNLSAIVLEEAYGRGSLSRQDGFLTAQELQELDLEGSQMLVLSQCRMADGIAGTGTGIYGMRRAASIAGVRSMMAPLWKVSDRTEGLLMDRFYRDAAQGLSRTTALRAAKLQVSKNRSTAHFFHWAPVILAGDPSPLPHSLFTK